jgi:uncharacterized OB-fold protein
MEDWRETQELLVMEGRIKVPYIWSAGEVGTRYLTALQEEGKFMGTRCPTCEVVYHVPRMHCPDCFSACEEWVELGPRGVLATFTVVRRHHPQLAPLPLPFAYGVIRLDGAGTGFVHLLHEFDEGGLAAGIRVEPVFAPEREGLITDVRYFRPLGEVA